MPRLTKDDLKGLNVSDAVRRANPSLFGGVPAAPEQDDRPSMTIAPNREDKLTKTEKRYMAYLRTNTNIVEIWPHAITFKLRNGHRYTPDFVVLLKDGSREVHEVKGSYKLGSAGRSILAFDQSHREWGAIFQFVWAAKNKQGGFDVALYRRL